MGFQDGDIVEIHYVGRIQQSGEIFDLTDPDVADEEGLDTADMNLGPVKVLIGEDYVLDGLEDHVREMDVGDSDTVEVPTEDAFGSRTSENIRTISKREFDEYDITPRRGMPVEVDGQRGKILTVSNGRVKVDFNHPLAGKDLEYDVEILRKVEDPDEQVQAVLEFHIGQGSDVSFDDGTATVTIHSEIPQEARDSLKDEIEKLEAVDTAVLELDGEDSSG